MRSTGAGGHSWGDCRVRSPGTAIAHISGHVAPSRRLRRHRDVAAATLCIAPRQCFVQTHAWLLTRSPDHLITRSWEGCEQVVGEAGGRVRNGGAGGQGWGDFRVRRWARRRARRSRCTSVRARCPIAVRATAGKEQWSRESRAGATAERAARHAAAAQSLHIRRGVLLHRSVTRRHCDAAAATSCIAPRQCFVRAHGCPLTRSPDHLIIRSWEGCEQVAG